MNIMRLIWWLFIGRVPRHPLRVCVQVTGRHTMAVYPIQTESRRYPHPPTHFTTSIHRVVNFFFWVSLVQ